MTFGLIPGVVSNQNVSDDSVSRLLCTRFNVTIAGYSATELHFEVPVQDWPATAFGQLWNETTGVRERNIDLNASSRTPGTRQTVQITPYLFNTSDTYSVGSYTLGAPGRYVYKDTSNFTAQGPLNPTTAAFRNGGNGNQAPDSTYTGTFLSDLTATAYVDLSPVTFNLLPQALDPTPGMITVNLVPAEFAALAQAMDPIPGMVTVQLVPAEFRLEPQVFPFDPVPGILVPSGSPMSTLTAAGSPLSTLTASGTP